MGAPKPYCMAVVKQARYVILVSIASLLVGGVLASSSRSGIAKGQPASTPVALLARKISPVALGNPRVPYVTPISFAPSGSDSPAQGLTWDIVLGQTTVATNSIPSGWTVSYNSGAFTISAPSSALDAPNYEVRLNDNGSSFSAAYDVVPRITAGGSLILTIPQGDTCATGTWDIILNGSPIASSSAPNGWSKTNLNLSNPRRVSLKAPFRVAIANNYELRLNDGYSGVFDVGFSDPTNIHPGSSNGVLDDSMTLPSWMEDLVPSDESDAPSGASATGSGGPSSAISVDLVHGVSSIDGGPDLIVNNPLGDDVVFERRYRSVMAAGNLSSPGLPAGWTHNWDFRIVQLSANSWGGMELVYPNGASEVLTPALDGNGSPTGAFFGPAGAPYVATGVPSGSGYTWTSITLSHNGLAKEVFMVPVGDAVMRLTQEFSSNGQPLNLSYNNGVLIKIDNAVNAGTPTMELDLTVTSGQITGITDAATGRARTYGYSGGELSTVSQINSSSLEWGYQYATIAGQPYVSVVQTLDPHGTTRSATIAYDSSTGRAQSSTDAKGTVRGYNYIFGQGGGATVTTGSGVEDQYKATADQANRITSSTNAAGDTTTLSYEGTDPSVVTTVSRPIGAALHMDTDSHGNITKVTYPYGNHTDITWQYPPDTPADMPFGRIAKVQEFGRNGETKQPVTYQYYAAGEPDGITGYLKEVDWAYGGFVSYTYTAMGNVATVTGPTTKITLDYTHPYSGGTVAERMGLPYSVTDLISRKSWFNYDVAGNLLWTRDPEGKEASFVPNDYDQVTQANFPLQHSVQFAHAVNGKSPVSAVLTATGNPITLFQNGYDGESATHATTDANNNTNTSNLDGQFGLSTLNNGNGVAMHSFTPQPFNRTYKTSTGLGARSLNFTSSFDPNGCLAYAAPTQGLASNGLSTTVQPNAIDGLRDSPGEVDVALNSAVRGPGYANTQYVYDGFGRVKQAGILAQLSPIPQDPNRHPQIPATISNSGGNIWTYDDLDRVTSETGDQSEVDYTYNPDGTRHTMIVKAMAPWSQSLGGSSSYTYLYTYDNAMRILEIDVIPWNGNTPVAWVKYAYDGEDNVLSVRTPKATTLYSYDDLGRVQTLRNLSADNTYDPYGGGNHVYTEPDTGIHHSITSEFTNITYDDLGNRTGMDFMAERKEGGHHNPPDQSTYGSGHVQFVYDLGGRLTQETWSGDFGVTKTLTHQYDSAGNLTQLRGCSWSGDPNSDQATSSSFPGYASTYFDDNGEVCTTSGTARTNQFYYHADGTLGLFNGADGPLAVFANVTHSEHYKYDGQGRRTERLLDGITLYEMRGDLFVYDGSMLVARQTDADSVQQSYTWLPTDLPHPFPWMAGDDYVFYVWGPTGVALELDGHGNTRSFCYDPQGNCIATAGPAFSISGVDYVTEYPAFYDGYGNPVWPYSTASDNPNYCPYDRYREQPLQYKGQFGYYTDDCTGLCYCLNRYYDPNSGRWMSRDPIGLEGGVNVYEYCGGNPVMFADPSGFQRRKPRQPSFWENAEDWFFATTAGQFFVGENWRKGTYTGGSAVLHELTFHWYTNHDAEQMEGYDGACIVAAGGRELLITAGTMGLAEYIQGIRAARCMSVYRSVNAAGEVQYVGITNNFLRRAVEHSGKFLIERIPGLSRLTRFQARAVEQCLIEYHGLAKNGGTLLNRINSIAASNPRYAEALREGARILRKAGYSGF